MSRFWLFQSSSELASDSWPSTATACTYPTVTLSAAAKAGAFHAAERPAADASPRNERRRIMHLRSPEIRGMGRAPPWSQSIAASLRLPMVMPAAGRTTTNYGHDLARTALLTAPFSCRLAEPKERTLGWRRPLR